MNLVPSTIWRYLRSGPALNLWAGYFCFGSTALYGILSLPLAVRFLDKEHLGLWNLVTQVVGYLLWLDLGVATMTGRTMAESIHSRDQDSIDRTWSSIMLILAVQATLILIAGFCFLPFFLSFFSIPGTLESEATFVYLGTVIVTALGLPMRAIPGVFLCQDRLHWSMITQGTMPWLNLLIFWIMLEMGYGVRSFVFSTAAVAIVQYLWLRHLLKTGGQELRFKPRSVSTASIRPIIGFSSSMMLWGIAPAAIGSIPSVIIGRQLGLDQVSIYNVTTRVPVMLASVALRTYHSFYPRVQKHYVAAEMPRFRSLYRLATWLSVWATGAVMLVAVFANETVVGFLARPDFFAGHLFTALIATGLLGLAVAEHLGSLFYCAGKAKLVSVVLAVEVVATFAVASFLCQRHGLVGMAAAIAFMPMLVRIPYFTAFGSKACDSNLLALYSPAMIGVIAILLISWGLWFSLLAGDFGPEKGGAYAMIAMGLVLSFLSIRSGWREFRNYRAS